MYKIRIKNLNEYALNNKDISNGFCSYLYNVTTYIRNYLITNFPFHYNPSYDLVVLDNNESYLTFNPKTYMDHLCKLVEIEYENVDFDSEVQYNLQRISNRIIELKNLKDENELFYKFPKTYQDYKERLELTKKALGIYAQYKITIPKDEAYNTMRRNIYSSGMDDNLFKELLNESQNITWQAYVGKIIYDSTLISNNINHINNMVSKIYFEHKDFYFDTKKINKLKKHFN